MEDSEFTEAIWHSDLSFVRRYLQQRRRLRAVCGGDGDDYDGAADSCVEDLGRNSNGDSPLHLCVRANAQPELFGLLLRSGGCCLADRNQDGFLAEDLFSESKFGPLYREELDCLAADVIRSGRLHLLETWLLRGWTVPDSREEAFRALVTDGTATEEQLAAVFDRLTRMQAAIDRLHERQHLTEADSPDSLRLLESLDQCGLTLLHKAVLVGDVPAAHYLLAARQDLASWPDCLGRPAAFYCGDSSGELLKVLTAAVTGGDSPENPRWNPLGCLGATADQLRARLAIGCGAQRRGRMASISSAAAGGATASDPL